MIYLVSHSGYFNYGDELIARQWIDFYRTKFPDELIVLDSCNAGGSILLFGNIDNFQTVDTLWSLTRDLSVAPLWDVGSPDEWRRNSIHHSYGLEIIEKARVVHVLGGGYLNDGINNWTIIAILTKLKKTLGFRLIATGLGVMPTAPERWNFIAHLFRSFDFVDFRDSESFNALSPRLDADKCAFSCDDAFISMPWRSNDCCNQEPRLILSLQPAGPIQMEVLLGFVFTLIDLCPFAQNGVVLLELDGHHDLSLTPIFENHNDYSIEIFNFSHLWANQIPINRGDFIFTTRFHAHLIAASLGAYGLCASSVDAFGTAGFGTAYYDIKHRSLQSMGSGINLIGCHDFHFDSDVWVNNKNTMYERIDTFRENKLDTWRKAMQV